MENYIIANRTDVGMARQVNEDSMITFDSPNGRVVAVCDGMGGQAAGDVASQLACNIIRDILENNTFTSPEEAITRSIMAANQGILHQASQNPQLDGMGATCVMIIIKDDMVYYGWVGDSRIYYISNHTIRQISRDQSYVQALVDSGQITPEEAEHHPQKNEIINALGIQGMTPPVLGTSPIPATPGSVFLLCSDGLTGMVDNATIERVVSKAGVSLQDKAEKLVELANNNGGVDNITVQLVEFTKNKNAAGGAGQGTGAKRKKASWRNILIMALTAVLIVVLGGGAAWYFLGGDNSKKNAAGTTQPGTEITDTRNEGTGTDTVKEQNGGGESRTVTHETPEDNSGKKEKKGKDPVKDPVKEITNGEKPIKPEDQFSNGKKKGSLIKYECDHEGCGQKFDTPKALNEHKKTAHMDVLVTINCKNCGKSFASQEELEKHECQ